MGILGVNLLTVGTAKLDFVTRRLTLTNDTAPLHPKSSGIVVPLHNKEGLYYMQLSAGGQKLKHVLIDTGSDGTDLPLTHITGESIQGITRSTNLNVNSRAEFTWDVLVSELQIGDLHEPNVEVGIAADNDDAVLGMNVLSRFCVTFNLARKQMLLEWADDYPQRATILKPEQYRVCKQMVQEPSRRTDSGENAWQVPVCQTYHRELACGKVWDAQEYASFQFDPDPQW